MPDLNRDEKTILLSASKINVSKASAWLRELESSGGTDILSPVQQAAFALHSHKEGSAWNDYRRRLSVMVVITDGAVKNEHEICNFANSISKRTRVFTLGIGNHCNSYFLRKLAHTGRGFMDISLVGHAVRAKMSKLFERIRKPLLTNIVVTLLEEGLEDVTWCPTRCQDLFFNSPVIISLKYKGKLRKGTLLVVEGQMPVASGCGYTKYYSSIEVFQTYDIPLLRITAQNLVQQLISESWFVELDSQEGIRLKNEAITLAISEQITTPFTSKVVSYSL